MNPVTSLASKIVAAFEAKQAEFVAVAQSEDEEETEILIEVIERVLDDEQKAGRLLVIGGR